MSRSKHCTKAGRRLPRALFGAIIGVVGFGAAGAQAKDPAPPAPKSIWEQDTLTGDWGGARTTLKDKWGIDFTLAYIGETLKVMSGGLNNRASYEGRGEFTVETNLEKFTQGRWQGATTHVTVYTIHNGSNYNALDNVGSVADPSNIDAFNTTRLFTAWYQQNFFGDRLSIRAGQLAADDEFITSPTAAGALNGGDGTSFGGLINGTFGWAAIHASNMTSGGPAYPLATPGVRVAVKATDQLTFLGAVFSGDPAGNCADDNRQKCDLYGTKFSTHGGSLWMGEMQYAVTGNLPGVYKLGGWHATTGFADQHFGVNAAGGIVSLADGSLAGALYHQGNWGVYGVADQMIARLGKEGAVSVFVRGGGTPQDRNLVSFYIDGGIGIKGALANRPNDLLTFGIAYSKISPAATALDRDFLAAAPPYAIRKAETVYELNYAIQIAPWWTLQPDLQYIVRPNGGQSVEDPTVAVGHAFYGGVRTTVKF